MDNGTYIQYGMCRVGFGKRLCICAARTGIYFSGDFERKDGAARDGYNITAEENAVDFRHSGSDHIRFQYCVMLFAEKSCCGGGKNIREKSCDMQRCAFACRWVYDVGNVVSRKESARCDIKGLDVQKYLY